MATSRYSTVVRRSAAPMAAATSAAAAPRRAPVAPPPSLLKEASDVVVAVSIILGMLIGLGAMFLYTRDSMAVSAALAEQSQQTSALVCKDGKVARGDGSLRDRVMEDGVFVCTDWRTLQALEMEREQRGARRY